MVKAIHIREVPEDVTRNFPFIRSCIMIDYSRVEEAQNALDDLALHDAFGTKRG